MEQVGIESSDTLGPCQGFRHGQTCDEVCEADKRRHAGTHVSEERAPSGCACCDGFYVTGRSSRAALSGVYQVRE